MNTRRQAIKTFLLGGLAGAGATVAELRLVRASGRTPHEQETLAGASTMHDGKIAQAAAPGQEHPLAERATPSYLKTISDIAAGEEISVARFVDPRKIAAIQSGTCTYDCGADLRAACASGARGLYLPRGIWRYTGELTTAAGSKLRGDGGGEYSVISDLPGAATVLERQDAGGHMSAVLTLGEACSVEYLQVRPAKYALAIYYLANYPAHTGNTPVGIRFGKTSGARHCTVVGLPHTGFELNVTSTLERCYAYMCDRGFHSAGHTDGSLINCIGMFCHTAGADLVDNFWQVIGGRWEWNARYGVILGAESLIVGAVLDRNGCAGVCMRSGNWGKVVSGNYFSRNGCGGDGSLGRWKFSKPTHPSYVEVPAGQSCHIQLDYQQGATIVGNRFRHGRDDDNDGCDGPQFVYGSSTASGSTPLDGIAIHGNFGDRSGDSIAGFNKAYPGGGSFAGGKDTNLVRSLNLGVAFERGGVASALHCGDQVVSPKTTRTTVNVLRGSSGRVLVRAAIEGHAQLAEILFATDAADAGYQTIVNNLIGNAVKGAVFGANPADDRYNRIDIVLTEPCFVSCSIFST
ncbi:hypothetical protein [Paraburkholderia rhynchosiae]|uniref:Uncharacterized protein n=1 Tax=Paraburkholderia rhynchosiae TaxID=487049 RepID=A0A2N7WNF3_9BURK|nr:hypothetical protein [Paraburkholderia rhynchosiae]PMS30977.1 hypothetical protein C0Z16_12140 [Paraburkholderia rhynchosiae]CAB3704276.1 hypothetical protein LMG27174_03850 [Paraburkholderia rhynchosiae]